jgi:hypothetical protein
MKKIFCLLMLVGIIGTIKNMFEKKKESELIADSNSSPAY